MLFFYCPLQGDAQVRGRWIQWIHVGTQLVIVKRAQLVRTRPSRPSLPQSRSLDVLT